MLLLLLLTLRTAEPLLQDQSLIDSAESQLSNCITAIADDYFQAGTSVVISVPSERRFSRKELQQDSSPYIRDVTLLLQQLHGKLKWPVMTSRDSANQRYYHNYILWAYDSVRKQLEDLKSFGTFLNTRGRFIIALNKFRTNRRKQAHIVLEELNNKNIVNAIVLVSASREQHTLDIYSWFPYQPPTGKCGKIRAVDLIEQWTMHKGGYFSRNVSLFPTKIPSDLGKCPLAVTTFPFPPFTIPGRQVNLTYEGGFEIRLLQFIAEAKNMSVVYKTSSPGLWGRKLENGSWTGMSRDLTLGRADIGLAGTVLETESIMDMDFTVSHGSLGFKWVVPCARPFPRWKSITRVYSLASWLLIFMTILIAAVVLKYLAKYGDQEVSVYRTLIGCLFCSWAVVLGVSADSAPVSGHVRSFFILWIWYSLAINTLFQTYVTSYLIDPGFQKQMGSVKDVLESGVQYGFHPDLNVDLFDDADELLAEVVRHRVPCNDVELCTQRVAERGDFVTISNHHRIQYLNTFKTLDEKGKALLCTFGDNLILRFKTFYLPQGSLLLDDCNRVMLAALQAGLVEHWWQSELVTSRIRAASITAISPLDNYSVLILTYVQSAFYLLVLGYGASLLVFAGELFRGSVRRN
jgi:hypothetical protein